jgi:hypothetical protein
MSFCSHSPRVLVLTGFLLLLTSKLLGNSGTQLPLNQYQAGLEQTTLVPNGSFEDPGPVDGTGDHPNPTGWTRDGNMFAGTPTFSNLTNTGSFAAQLRDTLFPGSYTQPAPALAAGANYVLSAYVWNAGRTGASGAGDLATVKVVDPGNSFNNIAMSLEATATDAGAGSAGYFMYIMLNQAQTAAWSGVNVQVIAEEGSVGGAIPTTWAQFDNVALTPAEQFVGQRWRVDTAGNWSENTNWLGRAPNQAGGVASFTDAITTSQTVTVDAPQTVGQINFDNSTSSYTLAGTATITLDVTADGLGNQQGVPEIAVVSGSHAILAPIALMRDTILSVGPAAGVLTLSNDVMPGGTQTIGLSKIGAGRADMKNVRMRDLTISAGTVRVIPTATANAVASTSRLGALSIAGGPAAPTAKLDLGNNSLVLDYAGTSPLNDVRQLLQAGYSAGAWNANGIISSRAATSPNAGEAGKTGVGYAEAAALGIGSFNGQALDADSIVMKYTYSGDSNLDGMVDITDLGNLATSWQTGATWIGGDFDYSGFVDITDLGLLATNWQAGVGSPLKPAGSTQAMSDALASLGLSGSAVPEPSACLSLIGALLTAFGASRSRGTFRKG